MIYNFATKNEIPDDGYTVRVKNTKKYIHVINEELFIKERMVGCFVCSEDTAVDLITKLRFLDFEYDLEYIKFSLAYIEHGLIEKQMQYN